MAALSSSSRWTRASCAIAVRAAPIGSPARAHTLSTAVDKAGVAAVEAIIDAVLGVAPATATAGLFVQLLAPLTTLESADAHATNTAATTSCRNHSRILDSFVTFLSARVAGEVIYKWLKKT